MIPYVTKIQKRSPQTTVTSQSTLTVDTTVTLVPGHMVPAQASELCLNVYFASALLDTSTQIPGVSQQ